MRLLLVEDDPDDVLITRDLLNEVPGDPWALECADSLSGALQQLDSSGPDAVLLDLGLPDAEDLEGLAAVRDKAPRCPVVILTGHDDQELALRAVRAGAQDYLVKGQFTSAALQRTILYAVERSRAGTRPHQEPSAELGGYHIVRLLGTGGMGKVYLAIRRGAAGFSKKVAIKRLLARREGDDRSVRNFLSEARLAAKLTHPNIVQIFELGESNGVYFIAMEYVPGHNLLTLLRMCRASGRAFPVSCAAYTVGCVCQALDHAHCLSDEDGRPLGLVHHDVSPHNVLISEAGAVKLTDFGVARVLQETPRPRRLSGKTGYMAPEHVRGELVDHRVDIYAAGVLLYELCIGSHPFARPSRDEILEAVLGGRYRDPALARPDLPPALVDLIRSAMALSPQDRPATAREMAEVLQRTVPPDVRVVEETADLIKEVAGMGVTDDLSELTTVNEMATEPRTGTPGHG